MKINSLIEKLEQLEYPKFKNADGIRIPPYFHVTELGMKRKDFIDCGGNLNHTQHISFQLWTDEDFEHRLTSKNFLSIIESFRSTFNSPNLDIEVEYQGNTLGSYDLAFEDDYFILMPKYTDCLAPDKCGVRKCDKPRKKCCGGKKC
jgi:hypothetical protein